jgi:adenosylhomocysteine nucleosidase
LLVVSREREKQKLKAMLAIFAALNAEVSSLKRSISISKCSVIEDCRIYEGRCHQRDCILVLTGVGKRRAQQAARTALERYPVKAMVSTGFSGALNSGTRVGDIVVYSGLGCKDKTTSAKQPESILQPDRELLKLSLKLLKEAGLPSITGRGVSLESVCATPEAKDALGKEFGADSVDMESYWLALEAQEKQIPFITVRSIFDQVNDDLSFMFEISTDGKIDQGAAAAYVLKHPGQIKNMAYLAKCARRAERNLAVFLEKVMEDRE